MKTSPTILPAKKNRNKMITIVLVIGIVALTGITNALIGEKEVVVSSPTPIAPISAEQYASIPTRTPNIVMQDGIQIITIDVGRGYSPRNTSAQAGIPTKIIFKGKNAYGCESAITIPKVGYRKNLGPNESDTTEVSSQVAGSSLDIVCSMGMYTANVKFL